MVGSQRWQNADGGGVVQTSSGRIARPNSEIHRDMHRNIGMAGGDGARDCLCSRAKSNIRQATGGTLQNNKASAELLLPRRDAKGRGWRAPSSSRQAARPCRNRAPSLVVHAKPRALIVRLLRIVLLIGRMLGAGAHDVPRGWLPVATSVLATQRPASRPATRPSTNLHNFWHSKSTSACSKGRKSQSKLNTFFLSLYSLTSETGTF